MKKLYEYKDSVERDKTVGEPIAKHQNLGRQDNSVEPTETTSNVFIAADSCSLVPSPVWTGIPALSFSLRNLFRKVP
jgi:hypothetical protein